MFDYYNNNNYYYYYYSCCYHPPPKKKKTKKTKTLPARQNRKNKTKRTAERSLKQCFLGGSPQASKRKRKPDERIQPLYDNQAQSSQHPKRAPSTNRLHYNQAPPNSIRNEALPALRPVLYDNEAQSIQRPKRVTASSESYFPARQNRENKVKRIAERSLQQCFLGGSPQASKRHQ